MDLSFTKEDRQFQKEVLPPEQRRFQRLASGQQPLALLITCWIMLLAPIGVFGLVTKTVALTGFETFGLLGKYFVVVLGALLIHFLVVLPLILRFIGKVRNPYRHFFAMRNALLTAFSTASSSATLPVTMRAVEDNLDVTNEVSSFVLPIGATVNMDGTALYQGVAAIFIAQIYGIELSVADQVTIVVSATMASVGAAGVPGAGMLTLAMVLAAVGVPVQGVALVIGVDRVLDMFRTTTNVIGDATAAVLVARLSGDDLKIVTPAEDAADPERGLEGVLEHPHPHKVVPSEHDDGDAER